MRQVVEECKVSFGEVPRIFKVMHLFSGSEKDSTLMKRVREICAVRSLSVRCFSIDICLNPEFDIDSQDNMKSEVE